MQGSLPPGRAAKRGEPLPSPRVAPRKRKGPGRGEVAGLVATAGGRVKAIRPPDRPGVSYVRLGERGPAPGALGSPERSTRTQTVLALAVAHLLRLDACLLRGRSRLRVGGHL